MQYSTYQDLVTNRWHVVYRIPATEIYSSVKDCLTEKSAKIESDRLNQLAKLSPYVEPIERRIVSGFYQDIYSS